MARKGRPRKSRDQKLKDAFERTRPADYIMDRRKLFSFVAAPKGGEIDSEICDPIGQLCALGLLDHHGHDPVEMRDKGRFWGGHYAKLMRGERLTVKTGSYERSDRSQSSDAITGADMLFDRMDENLPNFERTVLLNLLVDPLIGNGDTVYWAQALIDEALLKRGRVPKMVRFPDAHDRGLLEAAIRGLVVLVDGSLPSRWAA